MTDVLVLNFTYEALNITSFQRAVKLLFSGKAEMVHRRDDVIKSTSLEMKLPSIIRMLYYIKRPMQKVALTKKNVLLRDDYTCQYCQLKGERDLFADHAAHAAAEEVEVENGQDALTAIDARCASHHGFVEVRLPPRALESIAIRHPIGEHEWIDRHQRRVARFE